MTDYPDVKIKLLPHAVGRLAPSRATEGASGVDLVSAIDESAQVRLSPGTRVLVPTGISLALPLGMEGQVRPRSGLALHHGITCLNAPGTIDSDYRGEVMVLLINFGNEEVTINRGDRIAQLVLAPVLQPKLTLVDELPSSLRGAGAFGSTGSD